MLRSGAPIGATEKGAPTTCVDARHPGCSGVHRRGTRLSRSRVRYVRSARLVMLACVLALGASLAPPGLSALTAPTATAADRAQPALQRAAAGARRPNVILFLTDDQRLEDMVALPYVPAADRWPGHGLLARVLLLPPVLPGPRDPADGAVRPQHRRDGQHPAVRRRRCGSARARRSRRGCRGPGTTPSPSASTSTATTGAPGGCHRGGPTGRCRCATSTTTAPSR